MKKTLFLTACVAVAALFVACEPKGEETGNKFEFRESAIVLAEGSTQRLALVDDQNANDYVWESSDTLVVTVDELGVATGEGTGVATVTVTSGERKATCQVTVKPFMETLSFPMAIVWDLDTTSLVALGDTIVVRGTEEFHCIWAVAKLYLMSEGLYYDNDGYLTGADRGELMFVSTPALYDAEKHVQFVLGGYDIVPAADYQLKLHSGIGGYYEDAYKYYSHKAAEAYIAKYYMEEDVELGYAVWLDSASMFCSTSMQELYYYVAETDDDTGYYSYPWVDGFAESGEFELASHESLDNMCAVPYANIKAKYFDPNSWWGWEVGNPEAASVAELDLQWVEPIAVTYQHGAPSKAADRWQEVRVPVIKRDCPQMAAQLEKMMNTKNLHVRK